MRKPDAHSDLLAKLTAFESANPMKRGPVCTACRLPEKAQAFILAARERGSTFRSISAVLAGEGLKATEWTLGRHMRDKH